MKLDGLTQSRKMVNLVSMRLVKIILFAAVAVLLAGYSIDCDATATPDQAMHCCGSMPCSSQGHQGQDCCKTMPTMHAPFVKPAQVQQASHAAALALVAPVSPFVTATAWERMTSAASHAPPDFSPPTLSPLRI